MTTLAVIMAVVAAATTILYGILFLKHRDPLNLWCAINCLGIFVIFLLVIIGFEKQDELAVWRRVFFVSLLSCLAAKAIVEL